MSDFDRRLDAIGARLSAYTAEPPPAGLTEPDPGEEERWEAAQVWAHMAEFVGYWQDQMADVIERYDGHPISFGRTKRDPQRIGAIEAGRHAPVAELMRRTRDSLAEARQQLAALAESDWRAVGLHPTLGEMTMPQLVERFIVGHLEEHLDQLDGLRRQVAQAG